MKIAINATFRWQGGAELHLRNVLRAWCAEGLDRRHQITLFTRARTAPGWSLPPGANVAVEPIRLDWPFGNLKVAWEQLCLPRLAADRGFDVILCPGSMAPLWGSVPSVVVFQNAAPFCDHMTLRRTGPYRFVWFGVLGRMMRLSARSAARVVFVSHFFQELFERRYGLPSQKSEVIYRGRDGLDWNQPVGDVLARLGLRRPYILSVGHLYPYKNLPELIHGYGQVREVMQRRDLRLAIVGKTDRPAYFRKLRRLVSGLGLDGWVLFPGGVSHAEIGPLLAGCEFFVFQSTCENCPNALIEALAAGVPVACSNAGVMPEIAGNAALYFDPFDPADISRALHRMTENSELREELRALGKAQALKFPTWSEVGRLTLQALERAARLP